MIFFSYMKDFSFPFSYLKRFDVICSVKYVENLQNLIEIIITLVGCFKVHEVSRPFREGAAVSQNASSETARIF
jgi:hypothetical protein